MDRRPRPNFIGSAGVPAPVAAQGGRNRKDWKTLSAENKKPLPRTGGARLFQDHALAELFESGDEIVGDELRGAAFDLVTLDHVNKLSILKEGDGR
jgi:hypothetical protein